jgi:phage gp46-like protein
MADIPTIWDSVNSRGDWDVTYSVSGEPDQDLETALLISIFTDRTADPDDVIPDGTDDPRGWWGDLGEDRPIGSKLWLRMREKQTGATLLLIKNDLAEATQWFVDDGVASSVDVTTEYPGPEMIGCRISISRNGKTTQFDWAWRGNS